MLVQQIISGIAIGIIIRGSIGLLCGTDKVPKYYDFRISLPKSPTGKILKRHLLLHSEKS